MVIGPTAQLRHHHSLSHVHHFPSILRQSVVTFLIKDRTRHDMQAQTHTHTHTIIAHTQRHIHIGWSVQDNGVLAETKGKKCGG